MRRVCADGVGGGGSGQHAATHMNKYITERAKGYRCDRALLPSPPQFIHKHINTGDPLSCLSLTQVNTLQRKTKKIQCPCINAALRKSRWVAAEILDTRAILKAVINFYSFFFSPSLSSLFVSTAASQLAPIGLIKPSPLSVFKVDYGEIFSPRGGYILDPANH